MYVRHFSRAAINDFSQQIFPLVTIGKTTGVNNNFNNGFILFRCPGKLGQSASMHDTLKLKLNSAIINVIIHSCAFLY